MVELENVTKSYQVRTGRVDALRDVRVNINQGEFVVLRGPSGSGKTTLLMTIAAMLQPTSGSVRIEQNDLYAMSTRDRARFRARNIGFVFQMFHLVPYLNIVENVILASQTAGRINPSAQAGELLTQLGLAERASHKPAELSAGEKQRTAIARALFNRPKIILADEPTGNLDGENATSVFRHLSEFHRSGGTVIVATHGAAAEKFADKVINMREGSIESSA